MFTCKTGRHTWTNEENAAKCCNGWHRELRVATLTLGETLPPDADHVRQEAGAAVGYVWVRDAGDIPPDDEE